MTAFGLTWSEVKCLTMSEYAKITELAEQKHRQEQRHGDSGRPPTRIA